MFQPLKAKGVKPRLRTLSAVLLQDAGGCVVDSLSSVEGALMD